MSKDTKEHILKMELSKKALQLKKEYLRNWRKNNPEKLKQYDVNYWEKKASELDPGPAELVRGK